MTVRIAIGRKLRFEVFKRDGFTCQYCGGKAPDVLLVCDHVIPVIDGGPTDLLNLVTSCQPCNSGKGARRLDDDAMIGKQRRQLEELNERRIQIEMMLEWRSDLLSVEKLKVDKIIEIINSKSPKWIVTASGRERVERLVKKCAFEELVSAVDIAFSTYFKDDTGKSWNLAFRKIPGVMRVTEASKEKPYLPQLFYIRGILRNRLNFVRDPEAMDLMERAVEIGLDLDHFERLAKTMTKWDQFAGCIEDFISRQIHESKSP